MADNAVDWFIVFTQDPHLSEYTAGVDKYRAAISGFTGSAGTLLVGESEAYLWTDSRYYIQAKKELSGTGIELMKMGQSGVPHLNDFLREHVWEGQKIAFDLKTLPFADYEALRRKLPESVEIVDGDKILKEAVEFDKRHFNDIKAVPDDRSGRSTEDKLCDVRKNIEKHYVLDESYSYIVSDLASIMWLFNLRGLDIEYVPVAYSYAVVTAYDATLYVCKKALTKEAASALDDAHVKLKEYSLFYSDLNDIATDTVIADKKRNNAKILSSFDDNGMLKQADDAYIIKKAIKNDAEKQGMINAHLKDAVTMIRFIKRVKEMASSKDLGDEYTLSMMLDKLRLSNGCSSVSFETICAYADNGAIVHYSAHEGSAKELRSEGLLLVDSGGQYDFEGTTDVTRTIALGNVTDEERRVYTTVLKGNLNLMDAVFPYGYRGALLDSIAEKPLWDMGYYCEHGIGHGVGANLSVHESDVRISRSSNEWEQAIVPGIIVSDEPGVYIEGKFGVRLETLLLCEDAGSIDGNRMCRFVPLTLVPFDKDVIDFDMLSEREADILKKYNGLIWEKIGPKLNEDEQKWLKEIIDID